MRRWAAYPDVTAALDVLDGWEIPYGAVSNNVTAYQRNKLDVCGLQRISVLVGTDTVGVPKPAPATSAGPVRRFSAWTNLLGCWKTCAVCRLLGGPLSVGCEGSTV